MDSIDTPAARPAGPDRLAELQARLADLQRKTRPAVSVDHHTAFKLLPINEQAAELRDFRLRMRR